MLYVVEYRKRVDGEAAQWLPWSTVANIGRGIVASFCVNPDAELCKAESEKFNTDLEFRIVQYIRRV